MKLAAGPKKINKAFLCYPPVGLFQRGEERCQADIEGSATQAPHAPNDLGYIASVLRKDGIECALRDYPAERAVEKTVMEEIKSFGPDIVLISTTTPTFPEDVVFLKKVKELLPDVITVAKGSCFFSLPVPELKKDIYSSLDLAIYGEAEFIAGDLVRALKEGKPLKEVGGLVVDIGTADAARTSDPGFREDLDSLPFPARDLIKNGLYRNPLTGRPMATVAVSRGCPSQCIFCLTPIISGHKIRKRSVENVMAEIKECAGRYGIKDFFFRADTFTMDKAYVMKLCSAMKGLGLKTTWVANSRTDSVDAELLRAMKGAGCVLVAFGFESGNEDIQKKIKKNADSDDALKAVSLCKKAGLKTLGFFMIGFPWDDKDTVRDTYRLMRRLDCDFIEIHIALPFEGTELNNMCRELGLIKELPIGYNYFSNPYGGGTLKLSMEELVQARNKMIRDHYMRISYILRSLAGCRSFAEFGNYVRYGLRLAGNLVKGKCRKK